MVKVKINVIRPHRLDLLLDTTNNNDDVAFINLDNYGDFILPKKHEKVMIDRKLKYTISSPTVKKSTSEIEISPGRSSLNVSPLHPQPFFLSSPRTHRHNINFLPANLEAVTRKDILVYDAEKKNRVVGKNPLDTNHCYNSPNTIVPVSNYILKDENTMMHQDELFAITTKVNIKDTGENKKEVGREWNASTLLENEFLSAKLPFRVNKVNPTM